MIVTRTDLDNMRVVKEYYDHFEDMNDPTVNEIRNTIKKSIAIVCQYIADNPEKLQLNL